MTTNDPTGAYGIQENPDGPITCGTCGRRWAEDITPSGRCPWEYLHGMTLPYAGTEGHSESTASRDRAHSEAGDGTASARQTTILRCLQIRGERGATWNELAAALDLHHGQVTGSLSSLHKDGQISRLTERRGRSSIYVLPEFEDGRKTAPQGRRTAPERDLRPIIQEAIEEYMLDGFDGYCRQRDIPSTAWITEGDLDTLDLADKIIEALG